MIIGKTSPDIENQVKITYEGAQLGRVEKYSYLGLTIDRNIDFENHINNLIARSYNKIYMLGKLRKFIDPRTSNQIFKSYILPQLEYCDYLLIGARKSTLCKLQKAVNHILRICFKVPHGTSNFKLHTSAKLLPLKFRREIALLKVMYQCAHDVRYIEATSNRRGRSADSVCIHSAFPKAEMYKKSIFYQGPKFGNNLPRALKRSETLVVFKKRLLLFYRTKFLTEKVV